MEYSVYRMRCPSCNSTAIIKDPETGEIICIKCGFILRREDLDEGPEWRIFEGDETSDERIRMGLPPTLLMQDRGLSTVIDKGDVDASGRKLDLETMKTVGRLRKWHKRVTVHTSFEKNLSQALNELIRLGDKLKVPKYVLETAAQIYRNALQSGLVRGRSITSIIVASLYAAIRKHNLPRTIKEVAKVSGLDRKEVARCYRLLVRSLDITMPVVDPALHVDKIANAAGTPGRTAALAKRILKIAKNAGVISGKDPTGVAAAALYYACMLDGVEKDHKEIAKAAGITEVTIRNRFKSMYDALQIKTKEDLERAYAKLLAVAEERG